MALVEAHSANLPSGGGAFRLDRLTLGVFLTDQPTHRLAVGSDRRTDMPLTRHQGWILPAGSEGFCEYDAPLDVVTISFDPALLHDAGLDPQAHIAHMVGEIDPITRQMALGAPDFAAGGTLYAETMHRALAAHLVQTLRPQLPDAPVVDDARLRRALDYIHDHLADDLSLEVMAGHAAMSAHHFARAFKAALGASPLQYVIGARIDQARILLKTTDLTVAEIAWRVGYADISRFGQHFKRRVGATPGAYRAA